MLKKRPSTPKSVPTANDPLASPPFETTRHHLATYIVQLLLDRGVDAVAGGIYALRGVTRERGDFGEDGKMTWVLES